MDAFVEAVWGAAGIGGLAFLFGIAAVLIGGLVAPVDANAENSCYG